jgi:ATP-binding protein involved in chromosome partitioning
LAFFLFDKLIRGDIMPTKEDIMKRLATIKYPGFNRDIVSFGIIKEVAIHDKNISVTLDLRTKDNKIISVIEKDIKKEVSSLKDVAKVSVDMQSGQSESASVPQDAFLPQVKYKIAIASGKGGVGKSTISVNLALALARLGKKTGLLDSDIYGPSIPLMLGIHERPEFDGQRLIPLEKFGVKLMSLGFLTDEDSPVIWRGPLVMRALQQLMKDVNWGDIEIMIFDMPPGTGDAQLTLSQSVTLDGAIIISTPQDVALIDAVKGVRMFQKVNVPILGIIENMSYFSCPHCGERTDIFSAGGARRECERLEVNLLGEIPLDVEIRRGGDDGEPVVQRNPDHPQSQVFMKIAQNMIDHLE